MGKSDRSRAKKKSADKKKKREKRLRRERNRRRNEPRTLDDYRDEIDVESALEDLPPDVSFERVMRRIARATGHRSFASSEEMESVMGGLDEAARKRLDSTAPREEAQDLYFLARSPDYREHAIDMLEDALDLDPECADALALLALFEPEGEVAQIRAFERAIALAERDLLEPVESALQRGGLWDDVLSRPYIRARRMLSSTLYARGRFAEALSHAEAVLALEETDPLFTRGTVIGSLLAVGETQRASEQIDLLDDEQVAFGCWARALERFLAGDRTRAAQAVKLGRQANSLVEECIVADKPPDDDGDGSGETDEAIEASEIAMLLGQVWAMHPDAHEWLASGAPASTAAERDAAVRTFREPVSALFTLGEPPLFEAWGDYPSELGFKPSDVSELIRLATDPVIHDLEDAPGSWAQVHAWRALAQLGDADAVLPLLNLAREREDDFNLTNDLPFVLARIGEPAMNVLIDYLAEHEDDETARGIVVEALGKMVQHQPALRATIVDALGKQLETCEENDVALNDSIVSAAIDARAVELTPLIRRAYEAEVVDEEWTGTLAEVEEALASEPDPD